MFHFLHTFEPQSVLISLGPLDIHWYGIFIVTGILAAAFVILKLAGHYGLDKNIVIDAVFYIIIGGIIGARLYHVLLELPYYLAHPLAIFKLWQGGLAIHGAIIAGLVITWYYARRLRAASADTSTGTLPGFWLLTAMFVTGLSLAQAIGRWGNFFNQELFGRPTGLPWGIPIPPVNRPLEFYTSEYFHPTFLYESIGDILIFLFLLVLHIRFIKNKKSPNEYFLLLYLSLYSVLRFTLEFVRIDNTPAVLGLRWPQIASIVILGLCLGYYFYRRGRKKNLELE